MRDPVPLGCGRQALGAAVLLLDDAVDDKVHLERTRPRRVQGRQRLAALARGDEQLLGRTAAGVHDASRPLASADRRLAALRELGDLLQIKV